MNTNELDLGECQRLGCEAAATAVIVVKITTPPNARYAWQCDRQALVPLCEACCVQSNWEPQGEGYSGFRTTKPVSEYEDLSPPAKRSRVLP